MSKELTILQRYKLSIKEEVKLFELGYTTKDIKSQSLEQSRKIIKEQIRNPNLVKPSEKEINKLNRRVNEYNENIDNYVLQIQKKFPNITRDILQQAYDSGNPKEFLAKHSVTKNLTYGSTQRLGERGLLSDVPLLDLAIPRSTFDIDSKIFKNFKYISGLNAKLKKYDIKDPTPVKLNKYGKVPIKGFEEKNDVVDGVFLKPSDYKGENKEMATDLLLKIRGIR